MKTTLSALLVSSLLIGCQRQAHEDEARLRADLAIPADVALTGLAVTPTASGMFGREGLRVVGRFRLSERQMKDAGSTWLRAPRWQPLPLPAMVSGLRFP